MKKNNKPMTWKEIGYAFLVSPATLLQKLSALLIGANSRTADDGYDGDKVEFSLLGSLLDGIKIVGRAVSNFLYDHKKAIATAAWASLILAGAAVLTVFLWPAALAAVTTFTVAGFSIAGVVGTGLAAQLGAVAALTTVATSAAVYTVAAIANTIEFFIKCCSPKKPDANAKSNAKPAAGTEEVLKTNGAAVSLSGLGTKDQSQLRSTGGYRSTRTEEKAEEKKAPAAPIHAASPLKAASATPAVTVDTADEKSAAPTIAA